MLKGLTARRLADALFSLVTWAAAIAVVMWCFAWVTRWYVVVGVLLVVVTGAVLADRAKAAAALEAGDAAVPAPRDGEATDLLARPTP